MSNSQALRYNSHALMSSSQYQLIIVKKANSLVSKSQLPLFDNQQQNYVYKIKPFEIILYEDELT